MAFEIYKPRGERVEKLSMVSFSKSSIVLNNVAREKLNSDKVELAYDQGIVKVKSSKPRSKPGPVRHSN